MIRRAREQGWLKKPVSELESWASLFGVSFDGVEFAKGTDGRGCGVRASRQLKGGEHQGPLMTIPRDLVLSMEQVQQEAKSDASLRELLEACGNFVRPWLIPSSQTTRGAILVFLLYQCTVVAHNAGDGNTQHRIGTRGPFMDYVKFLPEEMLPTFWAEDELLLLAGTSLQPAAAAKVKSLQRQFDELRKLTSKVKWCEDYWWGQDHNLSFDDWLQVDAMYRSRALEYPGIGDAMVPCVDMANHASRAATKALYETDAHGNAILILLDGVEVAEGEEITITYGDNKGACEMLFSYGFIEDNMSSAEELFLYTGPPNEEDPLGQAKARVATVPPGVKIFLDKDGNIAWHGDYLYLLNVNEEDGLDFVIAQTTDGEQELQMLWKDSVVRDTTAWCEELQRSDQRFEIYRLRATSVLHSCVERQLDKLQNNAIEDADHGDRSPIRTKVWQLAHRLWELESRLLQDALRKLGEDIKSILESSEVVQKYLQEMQEGGEQEEQHDKEAEQEEDEDFS